MQGGDLAWRASIHKVTCPLVSSPSKLKPYLHLQSTYEHQTKQGGDLSWQASTLEVALPFDHVTNVWAPENLKKLSLGHQTLQGEHKRLSCHRLLVPVHGNSIYAKLFHFFNSVLFHACKFISNITYITHSLKY